MINVIKAYNESLEAKHELAQTLINNIFNELDAQIKQIEDMI